MTDLPTYHVCASPYHKGKRWLPACYFYRNKRAKTGLQSYCMTCTRIQMRGPNQSETVKQSRREYSRKYKARKRREAGVPQRRTQLANPQFDPKELYEYISQWLTEEENVENSRPRILLNGIPLTVQDSRYLNRLKREEFDRAPLERIDALATDYDLPLWEMIDAAGRYKIDIRTKRNRRAARSK